MIVLIVKVIITVFKLLPSGLILKIYINIVWVEKAVPIKFAKLRNFYPFIIGKEGFYENGLLRASQTKKMQYATVLARPSAINVTPEL